MKTRPLAVMVLAVWVLNSPLSFAQKSDSTESAPDYEISKEIKLKGVIDEVRDRVCSISGSMGSHLMVKIGDKIYEVHVAPVRFVKMYGPVFQKGDRVEIIGVMTKFQGVDAILPREIKHGDYGLVFRDKKGKPIW